MTTEDTNSRCHQQLRPHNTIHKHTRVPNTALQQTSSPDITTVSKTLYNQTLWTTPHALSSDHLPIIPTINIRHEYRLQHNRWTFTNYKKTDWTQFTEDTDHHTHQYTHCQQNLTNIMLRADKHNIPKGKMHSNYRLLPEDIVCKITQRNTIKGANTCDPSIKLLNEEITSNIRLQTTQNEQCSTALVAIDLSAAFDLVNHSILLERLYTYYGISGTALECSDPIYLVVRRV